MSQSKISHPIIAIDGYSSTGKSSYAKMLAKKFGWKHVDTGAMYRAVALYGIQFFFHNQNLNITKLISHLSDIHINFKFNPDSYNNDTYLNGVNVESEIRDMKVSDWVSPVAERPEIRKFLVEQQRKIGEKGSVVMDGRDIGTVVFPNADLKFFITASAEERAKRRFLELHKKDKSVTLEEVTKNLQKRDYIDQNRKVSPLVMAPDAILIDNTHLTQEETYKKIEQTVVKTFNLSI